MIYFILPPIVIVIGITLIVAILSKKSGEVEKLKSQDGKSAPLGRKKSGVMKKTGNLISTLSLRILEMLIQRFKILSLRFHNSSSRWFQRIKTSKEKKEKAAEAERVIEPVIAESETRIEFLDEDTGSIIPEEEPPKIERKRKFSFMNEVRPIRKKPPIIIEEEEIEPMISRRVIRPDSMSEAKSKFEEILIERIAANPRDIEAYERLGEYYLERKVCTDAKECFSQVIKLSPGHFKAKLRLRKIEKMTRED